MESATTPTLAPIKHHKKSSGLLSTRKEISGLIWIQAVPERSYLKQIILKKKSVDDNKSMKIYPACKELISLWRESIMMRIRQKVMTGRQTDRHNFILFVELTT